MARNSIHCKFVSWYTIVLLYDGKEERKIDVICYLDSFVKNQSSTKFVVTLLIGESILFSKVVIRASPLYGNVFMAAESLLVCEEIFTLSNKTTKLFQLLKSSRNKKGLCDVTAAPILVSFSQLLAAKKHRKHQ